MGNKIAICIYIYMCIYMCVYIYTHRHTFLNWEIYKYVEIKAPTENNKGIINTLTWMKINSIHTKYKILLKQWLERDVYLSFILKMRNISNYYLTLSL